MTAATSSASPPFMPAPGIFPFPPPSLVGNAHPTAVPTSRGSSTYGPSWRGVYPDSVLGPPPVPARGQGSETGLQPMWRTLSGTPAHGPVEVRLRATEEECHALREDVRDLQIGTSTVNQRILHTMQEAKQLQDALKEVSLSLDQPPPGPEPDLQGRCIPGQE